MMKLTKSYETSLTVEDDLKTDLAISIAHACTTFRDIWKVIRGKMDITALKEGRMRYRTVTIKIPSEYDSDTITQLVDDIISHYKLKGIKPTITKQRKITLTLENALAGDRVEYYTIDIKGNDYNIRKVTLDLEIGETLEYKQNMFRTRLYAQQMAEKIMEML